RDRAALIAMSESQALTAITITATEKAYQVTDGHESDLPSRIAALLAARFDAKRGGLSIISCDNLTSNGELIKKLVLEASAKLDKPGLINWIERENYFPNSMVDRIVPAITAERIDSFEAEFGYRDESLLTTEPFTQWVIENCPLSQTLAGTGVEFVDDVAGYEITKIRIFNGAHSTIAYLGELAGLEFIADGINNPAINSFIAHLQENELAKSFTSPPGMDPIEYAKRIRARISNLNLRHRCQQIAMDGSLKLTQRLFPTINDLLAKQLPTQYIATAIAVWLRYLEINDRISDPLAGELVPLARNSDAAIATKSVLTHEKLLVKVNPGNFEAISQALEKLRSKPVLEVLTSL
ncbi:MAG: mannitol dehydrogenase family protein, partial [Actinomycetes bacterium]